MPSWWLGKSKKPGEKEKSSLATLERKTAEITAKLSLARLSGFRRHSAPAQPSRAPVLSDLEILEDRNAGGKEKLEPVKLSVLPEEILDLVLQHLSLKDLARSVALVHTSWRTLALSEKLWKDRLLQKVPRVLTYTFKLSFQPWSKQVRTFYSSNLVSNATFPKASFSVATGIGAKAGKVDGWRTQLSCWKVDNPKLDSHKTALLCESCGGENKIKFLTLSTPEWAHPEATQEIDLVAALAEMGLHPGDAIQFLDSCPEMEFSVWVSCGDDQPEQWRNGFAAVVLDNGIDRAAVWESVQIGTQIHRNNANAMWISYVFDDSLLRGCEIVRNGPKMLLKGKCFKKVSCIFRDYHKGIRRAHVLLKGLDPRMVHQGAGGKHSSQAKATAEFCAPVLRFKMPPA